MGRKSWTGGNRFLRRSGRSGAKRKPRRILLMGVEKVGKTALIKRFIEDKFTPEYKPTVEDNYNMDYKWKNYNLNLEFIDMSGCYQFPVMRDLNIRNADMIMLVYETNNLRSLEEIKNINGIVKVARSDALPTVLVGTKSDLAAANDDNIQKVLDDFLEAYPDCTHVTTSAKDSWLVSEAFDTLLSSLTNTISGNTMTLEASRSGNGVKDPAGSCCSCVLL